MNELNADDIRRLATVNRSRVNIRVTKVFSPTAGGVVDTVQNLVVM